MSYFAEKLKKQRTKLGLTMQALADRSQISKSMICKMESGDVQPTIDVAARVARSLEITLSEMLHSPQKAQATLVPKDKQSVWEDKHHIKRRTISPVFEGLQIDWLEIEIPPKGNITKEQNTEGKKGEKYILVIQGNLEITIEQQSYRLNEGDSFYFATRTRCIVENPGDIPAKFYAVAHYY